MADASEKGRSDPPPGKGRARIGAYGPGTPARLWDHANRRFIERVIPRGVGLETFLDLVRVPNLKKRDEVDPDHEDRIRRWVRLPDGVRARVVIRCVRDLKDGPETIEVVTVCLLKEGQW